ncbi:hypothetical protein DSECCO2_620990 [anaerobic digester metagenome]
MSIYSPPQSAILLIDQSGSKFLGDDEFNLFPVQNCLCNHICMDRAHNRRYTVDPRSFLEYAQKSCVHGEDILLNVPYHFRIVQMGYLYQGTGWYALDLVLDPELPMTLEYPHKRRKPPNLRFDEPAHRGERVVAPHRLDVMQGLELPDLWDERLRRTPRDITKDRERFGPVPEDKQYLRQQSRPKDRLNVAVELIVDLERGCLFHALTDKRCRSTHITLSIPAHPFYPVRFLIRRLLSPPLVVGRVSGMGRLPPVNLPFECFSAKPQRTYTRESDTS